MRLLDYLRRNDDQMYPVRLDNAQRFVVTMTAQGALKNVVRAEADAQDPQAALIADLAKLPEHARAMGEWTNPVERCPQCNAHVLVNGYGRRWCSYSRCDWQRDADV